MITPEELATFRAETAAALERLKTLAASDGAGEQCRRGVFKSEAHAKNGIRFLINKPKKVSLNVPHLKFWKCAACGNFHIGQA